MVLFMVSALLQSKIHWLTPHYQEQSWNHWKEKLLNMLTQTYNLIPHCSLKKGEKVETSEGGYNTMGQEFLCKNKAKDMQYGISLLKLNLMTIKVLFQLK